VKDHYLNVGILYEHLSILIFIKGAQSYLLPSIKVNQEIKTYLYFVEGLKNLLIDDRLIVEQF